MTNSNSSLICYTKISPNRNIQSSKNIKYVAIHCVVGQCAIESLGSLFALPSKAASSNYGVDKDGRVGMFVEEKDRSWCTSSSLVDGNGISIEVASDAFEPYAVRNAAFESLLNLLEDICKRNGKKKLLFLGTKEKSMAYEPKDDEAVMVWHCWFQSGKSCPGQFLKDRHPAIAEEINRRLSDGNPSPSPAPATAADRILKGDHVKIIDGATYTNGKVISKIIRAETWIVSEVKGELVRIDKAVRGGWSINSWLDKKYLKVVDRENSTFEPYIIRVEVDALNIRLAPSTLATVVGTIRDRGAYTIVAEADGVGATRWGKLKSGAGWISLDFCKFVRKAL